jgi:rhodanese-related sulfurtransferase
LLETEEYSLLDVRNMAETAKHRMIGSVHIPLNILRNRYAILDRDKKWLVYCAGGYRSMIAASFLRANGFHFVASIEGGIKEVIRQSPKLVEMDVE